MLHNLVITAPVSEAKLEELRAAFDKVTYHPDGQVDAQTASEANIWYTTWLGLPKTVTSLEQVPNTEVIQLSSGEARQLGTAQHRLILSRCQRLSGPPSLQDRRSEGEDKDMLSVWCVVFVVTQLICRHPRPVHTAIRALQCAHL